MVAVLQRNVLAIPRKVFYGWWMVLSSIALSTVIGGFYVFGFSAYFTPLVQEFGWSRTQLSGVISAGRWEGGILGPLMGFLVDRFGPRRVVVTGLALMGLGFLLFSRVHSLLEMYLLYIFIFPLSSSMAQGMGARTAVANWFRRKRGLAMGLLVAGNGYGSLLVPVVTWILLSYGWRTAAVVGACALWGVGIPLALMLRHRPETYGQFPDGIAPGAATASAGGQVAAQEAEEEEENFTPRQALRTRAFWMVAIAQTFWSLLPAIPTIHLLPYLIEVGLDPRTAALAITAYGSFSATCRIGIGWLGDRVSRRAILVTCWVIQVGGILLLSRITQPWQVIPFILLFGPAYGGVMATQGAFQAEYFGRRFYGTISGMMSPMTVVSGVVSPVLIGFFYDNFGHLEGYRQAFVLLALVNLLGAFAILAAKRPHLKPAEGAAA